MTTHPCTLCLPFHIKINENIMDIEHFIDNDKTKLQFKNHPTFLRLFNLMFNCIFLIQINCCFFQWIVMLIFCSVEQLLLLHSIISLRIGYQQKNQVQSNVYHQASHSSSFCEHINILKFQDKLQTLHIH